MGCNIPEVRYEPSINVADAEETSKFRLVGRFFGVLQALRVYFANFQGYWSDDVAEVLDGITEEATPTNFKCNSGHFKGCEDLINVGDVVLDGFGVYNNVVKIYQTRFTVEFG